MFSILYYILLLRASHTSNYEPSKSRNHNLYIGLSFKITLDLIWFCISPESQHETLYFEDFFVECASLVSGEYSIIDIIIALINIIKYLLLFSC